MSFTLIQHGQVYAPQPLGVQSLLLVGGKIIKIGVVDTTHLLGLGLLQYYFDHDGPPDHLTVSSDGHTPGGSPSKLYQAFVTDVRDYKLPLADVLPLFTSNPARALQLRGKGQLQEQQDADLLILHPETLDIVHLFASGRQFIRDGQLVVKSKQEEQVEESAK